MAFRVRLIHGVVLLLPATGVFCQEPEPVASNPPIVQPGAPGQSSRTIPAADFSLPRREPTEADIQFMQGMIHHHAQAVEMAALLRAHGRDRSLQELGKRISISQTDEIKFMSEWLADYGKLVPMMHDHTNHAAGMKSMDMSSMPPMPGMLTPRQMETLAKARGRSFDHLFLQGMIQHHKGALVMVQELFDTAGAGQESVLFDFATDIDNTQRAEIGIMERMLKEKK